MVDIVVDTFHPEGVTLTSTCSCFQSARRTLLLLALQGIWFAWCFLPSLAIAQESNAHDSGGALQTQLKTTGPSAQEKSGDPNAAAFDLLPEIVARVGDRVVTREMLWRRIHRKVERVVAANGSISPPCFGSWDGRSSTSLFSLGP